MQSSIYENESTFWPHADTDQRRRGKERTTMQDAPTVKTITRVTKVALTRWYIGYAPSSPLST